MPTPAHKPTEGTRAQVDALAGLVGLPQPEIAAFLAIDMKTLRKHYRKELDTATVKANAAVAKALFTKATKGNDTAAMIFWLKSRAKWREKTVEEVENDVQMPTRVNIRIIDASVPREP
jgi:hypothetical protein